MTHADSAPRADGHAAGDTDRHADAVHDRRQWAIGLAIALAALLLRFWRIGHTNLWTDEVGAVDLARRTIPEILANVRQSPHGPGYYVLLHWWMTLFGTGEAASRALSAVTGAAVVLAVYRIALRIGAASGAGMATRLASIAAVLTALSPVQLYFSQESRFHMVATAFAVAALAGYLAWRERAVGALGGWRVAGGGWRERGADFLRFVVPTALALYAYPLCALVTFACWVDAALLLLSRDAPRGARTRVAGEWLLLNVAMALLCVPLVIGRGLGAGAISSTQVWRTALGVRGAADAFFYYPLHQFQSRFLGWDTFPGAFGAYRDGMRWWPATERVLRTVSLPLACVVVAATLALALRRSWRTPWRAVWLAALVPLAAESAISVKQSLELSRYALFVAPPLFLLVARGLLALRPRAVAAASLVVLLATMAFGIVKYEQVDVRDSDYRLVADLLRRGAHAGDSVVASPWYVAPTVSYYVPSLTFEIREKYRHGWSNAGFPSRTGPTGDWWLVVDYRGGDLFHAPVDSIEGAATFGGARVRAVLDTMLPTSIRVLKLVPRG